ncbi:hypothetical protein [Lutimaribacter saemankumensis]|uniref:Uncharacterized protein n=1 Tax=Lutimaribacter saemankumensis TaxID=490829 RepID=A0A1G8RHP4_9RHOB|nr:hypothetical protein [Lutimaribacter saemankumensis]SDJ16449.1 hypothetical protein SAMN05421850_109126 [Lutimaribacter saemankumensis]
MADNWYSKRSQVYWTCSALVQGRSINHRDEIAESHGWRLGAIIHTLRSKYGWPIKTDYQGPERVAHYRLSRRTDWRALEFPRSATALKDELEQCANTGQQGAGEAAGTADASSDG